MKDQGYHDCETTSFTWEIFVITTQMVTQSNYLHRYITNGDKYFIKILLPFCIGSTQYNTTDSLVSFIELSRKYSVKLFFVLRKPGTSFR